MWLLWYFWSEMSTEETLGIAKTLVQTFCDVSGQHLKDRICKMAGAPRHFGVSGYDLSCFGNSRSLPHPLLDVVMWSHFRILLVLMYALHTSRILWELCSLSSKDSNWFCSSHNCNRFESTSHFGVFFISTSALMDTISFTSLQLLEVGVDMNVSLSLC